MTKSTVFLCLLGLFGLLVVASLEVTPAQAQVARAWVSGSGDDVNPCSRTAPCRTFAAAVTRAAPGYEVNVLDPADYGPVTITDSMNILNDGSGEAGILISGGNGIVINAAATDVVTLRGLIIDGTNTSSSGISILSAARVNIENCVIQEFATGVDVTPSASGSTTSVKVQDSTIINNTAGLISKPTGGAAVVMSIDHSRIDNNFGGGMKADGTGGGSSSVSVRDSSINFNASNGVNGVTSISGSVQIDLTRDVIATNGLAGVQSNGVMTTMTVGDSILSNNGTAWSAISGGSLLSYGNNQVTGPAGTGPSGGITPQ
jgi:hypothetical protein